MNFDFNFLSFPFCAELDDDAPSPKPDGETNGTNGISKSKVEENGLEDTVNGNNNNTHRLPGIQWNFKVTLDLSIYIFIFANLLILFVLY